MVCAFKFIGHLHNPRGVCAGQDMPALFRLGIFQTDERAQPGAPLRVDRWLHHVGDDLGRQGPEVYQVGSAKAPRLGDGRLRARDLEGRQAPVHRRRAARMVHQPVTG